MAHVLVVDDDDDIRGLVTLKLHQAGFSTDTAEDGRAALDCVEAQQPDLIVLDLMMPEMSGYDVLRELRSRSETRLLPVLLLSAKSQPAGEGAGAELGSADFMLKPFQPRAMVERVRAMLDEPRRG